MFGSFQQSTLRIEVDASAEVLQRCLTQSGELVQWLRFQRFPIDLPPTLELNSTFLSLAGGLLPVRHTVQCVENHRLCLLLGQSIDGFHEWAWGDGWVQSRIEGISLLPIDLGQTLSLLSLKQHLKKFK
ncbi:hypothetical protein ACN4EG_00790 [Alkalinema pantanalense CENA528]|uniref:hypothetical protein n=1 Tax=Alkalinema pantanalense TaxID=1620705 RepID=UPI003D6FE03A